MNETPETEQNEVKLYLGNVSAVLCNEVKLVQTKKKKEECQQCMLLDIAPLFANMTPFNDKKNNDVIASIITQHCFM